MRIPRLIGVFGIGLVAAAVLGTHQGSTLTISGSTAPADFISHNNHVYVPLAAVAQALHMTISKSGGSYSLSPAGGANQVQGLTGKMGDTVNCGFATVKLVRMTVTDNYKYQFSDGSIVPNNSNEQIYALVMRVKNATNKSVLFDPHGTDHTALVDNDEHSYHCYHGPGPDFPSSDTILPGAACDFALTFSVPKSETPTQLVYGMWFYGMNTSAAKDMRIDLKP